MSTTKITKAMRTNDIISHLRGEVPANGSTVEEMISYLEHELELIAKKSSSKNSGKPTAKQKENEEYKTQIIAFLSEQETPVGCADIANSVGISTQRAAALLTAIAKMGVITKSKEKGKVYYSIACADAEEE